MRLSTSTGERASGSSVSTNAASVSTGAADFPPTRPPQPAGPPLDLSRASEAEASGKLWRHMGTRPTKEVPAVRLLRCYDDTVDAIVLEMDDTREGDRIEFSVYVLEPGESTQRVLLSMRRAAERGVRVHCSLDCSVISSFTRWCEGTETLADELYTLEREFPNLVKFQPQTTPTHAKFVMCHRANKSPTAVFGGINIGDRFRPWRDFAIRAEGNPIIGALSLNINGPMGAGVVGEGGIGGGDGGGKVSGVSAVARSAREMLEKGVALTVGSRHRFPSSDINARSGGVGFVTNRPSGFDILAWIAPWLRNFPGKFDLLPALEALMSDERYTSYQVAAAYVDGKGASVLEAALDRGADVALVMPRNPNVYHDANRKALAELVDKYGVIGGNNRRCNGTEMRGKGKGRGGTLTAYMCDDMLHAKVFVARGPNVESAAMIGSCNLKQRSFGQFAELNALVVQPQCTSQLAAELDILTQESKPVTREDLKFAEPKATIEEWLG